MVAQRRVPNEHLRRLLTHADWTMEALARTVNTVAAETGRATRYDRTAVAHWLTGTHPQPDVPALIAEAFSRKLRREVTPTDLGLASGRGRSAWGQATPATVLTDLAWLTRTDLDPAHHTTLRHEIYHQGLAVAGWREAISHSRIPAPRGPGRSPSGADTTQVAAARHMTGVFALAIRCYGGRHARTTLIAYLAHDISTGLRVDTTNRSHLLMGPAADLVCLAGFTAFDTHAHALAQRYCHLALALSVLAEDPARYALTLRLLSQQAGYLGHHEPALTLATTALNATVGLAPPGTEAFLHAQVALCHAALGHHDTATHHLRLARHHLGRTAGPATILGTAHAAELAYATAGVRAFLGDHVSAITALGAALRHYPTTDRCSHALTLTTLAHHHLDTGHLADARTTWNRIVTSYPHVDSARAEVAVRTLHTRLRPTPGVGTGRLR